MCPPELEHVVERTLENDRERRTITTLEASQLASARLARLVSGALPPPREPVDLAWIRSGPDRGGIRGSRGRLVAPAKRARAMGSRKGAARDWQARRQLPIRGPYDLAERAPVTSPTIRVRWNNSRGSRTGRRPGRPAGRSLLSSIHSKRHDVEATGVDADQGR